MPRRTVELEVLSAHPRDQLSSVSSAEIQVTHLKGFPELSTDQQEAVRHLGGTMAEFWSRRTFTYGLPSLFDRLNLYKAFVPVDQVLDEEDHVRALGVPERFIQGAHLISSEQAIKEVCERNGR